MNTALGKPEAKAVHVGDGGNPTSPSERAESIKANFLNPPDSAKPHTFWSWMNGNITKEGITADLEAMKRVGVSGADIFNLRTGVPPGPVTVASPEFFALTTHAAREAARLGIELGMMNCAGWSTSGGPWIKPEQSMQMVVWSEAHAKGPTRFEAVLPKPQTNAGYYQDIALLAFPTPPEEGPSMAEAGAKFSYGEDSQALDGAKLTDGNASESVNVPAANGAAGAVGRKAAVKAKAAAKAEGKPTIKGADQQTINIEFPAPFTARSLTLSFEKFRQALRGELESSSDGSNFDTVTAFELKWPADSVNFEKVAARYYRLSFKNAAVLGEVKLSGAERIEDIPAKSGYDCESPYFTGKKPSSPGGAIRRDQIVELSSKISSDGKLVWDVPQGNWTLLRIGHTSTGVENHPAPDAATGLECDKLSKKALDAHFAGFIGEALKAERAAGVKGLTGVTVDSWEARSQNWTPGFREEFRKRMGYDPVPNLAVLTGRPVESAESSERFLWDLRRTVADMLVENYAGHLSELCHQNGLKLSIEGYGTGCLDSLPYAGRADATQGEFWQGAVPKWTMIKQMSSAAHIYGKQIAGAEAFTTNEEGKWKNYPFRLKPLGDEVFTLGVNRLVFHRYAHQPWLDRKPGMTMGTFGLHFDRTETWWEQARAWLAYLARCQYLLQQGTFVADLACLMPEQAFDSYYMGTLAHVTPPPGFDNDALSAEMLNQMTVKQKRLTLPSGMSYQVLMLPPATQMRVAQLRKIKQLVEEGAVVCGLPPQHSPSLADGPNADAELRRLVDELWGDCDGVYVREHSFGRGKVVCSLNEKILFTPDFSVMGSDAGKQIRFIHRRVEDKEVYFLASNQGQAATFYCNFRVSGKRPELWHPDTGRIEQVAIYGKASISAMTRIPIQLDPYGSVFVVFTDDKPEAEPVAAVTRDGADLVYPLGAKALTTDCLGKLDELSLSVEKGGYRLETTQPGTYQLKTDSGKTFSATIGELPKPLEIEGPWDVFFAKGWGAPEQVNFPKLISWPTHPDQGVKYFSGTASYRRKIEIPAGMVAANKRVYLDLGRVAVMGEAKLNGKDLGILWKPPYRVDITVAAHAGTNDLEVQVVNLWPNRLIGDEQLPEDTEHVPTTGAVKRWPQWLLDGKPSPTGRLTFATWKHWNKDDNLLESGLLGPVRLIPVAVTEVKTTDSPKGKQL